jgi:hypothetical protein
MSTDTRTFDSEMKHAVDTARELTPSVLALAIVAKISPKAFAQAIANGDDTASYRAELVTELLPLLVAEAKAQTEAYKNSQG